MINADSKLEQILNTFGQYFAKQPHSETRSTGTAVSAFRFKISRTGNVDMGPAGIGGELRKK